MPCRKEDADGEEEITMNVIDTVPSLELRHRNAINSESIASGAASRGNSAANSNASSAAASPVRNRETKSASPGPSSLKRVLERAISSRRPSAHRHLSGLHIEQKLERASSIVLLSSGVAPAREASVRGESLHDLRTVLRNYGGSRSNVSRSFRELGTFETVHSEGSAKRRTAAKSRRALISGDNLLEIKEVATELEADAEKEQDQRIYKLVGIFTCVLCFMLGIVDTVFWPYMAIYITENLQMSESKLGFIMAAYASPNFITFAFLARLLNKYGPWKVVTLGAIVTAISAVFYSLQSFFLLLFAAFLHGSGWCLVESGIQALVGQFPSKMHTLLAANSAAQMTGGLAGPLLAAVLCMFVPPLPVPGVCIALGVTAGATMLATELRRFYAVDSNHCIWSLSGELVPKREILKRRVVVLGCLGVVCSYILNGFLMVGSYTHVKQALQISTSMLAIIFIVPQMVYSLTAGCTALLGSRLSAATYGTVGMLVMGISLMLLGPAPFLVNILKNPVTAKIMVMLGLIVFEAGSAFFYMPLVPMMQNAVLDLGVGGKNTVVSLYVLVQGVGELLGRGLSGIFIQYSTATQLLTCSVADVNSQVHWSEAKKSTAADSCWCSFPKAATYLGIVCVLIGILISTFSKCGGCDEISLKSFQESSRKDLSEEDSLERCAGTEFSTADSQYIPSPTYVGPRTPTNKVLLEQKVAKHFSRPVEQFPI